MIPKYVEKIEEKTFWICNQFKKIEIQENLKLQIIEKNAFLNSSIEELFSIPSSILNFEEE